MHLRFCTVGAFKSFLQIGDLYLQPQSFALLARSAYFALLSRLNARTKQSFVLVLLKLCFAASYKSEICTCNHKYKYKSPYKSWSCLQDQPLWAYTNRRFVFAAKLQQRRGRFVLVRRFVRRFNALSSWTYKYKYKSSTYKSSICSLCFVRFVRRFVRRFNALSSWTKQSKAK